MSDNFIWTSKGGVTVSLPSLSTMPSGVFRKHRKLEPVDFVFSIVEDVADADTLALLDQVPLPEINDLFEAWQAGAPVGESSGSST